MEVVKEGLKKFAERSAMCDVAIALYSGKVSRFLPAPQDTCYTSSRLSEITWDQINRGTAIGDGIVHGVNSIAKGEAGRIVVFGDGDNTAGLLDIEQAARIAKEEGLKVYAIGVGRTGLVPFGHDYFGRPNMIDNTFTDRDFKTLVNITGGQYIWAKDSDAIADALEKFLKQQ
jgi:Ca-activated chloride channel homolog